MLTKEHELLRETLRRFVEKEIKPKAREIDETEGFHLAGLKKLGELGLLGVTVPETYGGGGMDWLGATIAIEELGRVCASTALSYLAHTILCVNNILWDYFNLFLSFLYRAGVESCESIFFDDT